MPTRLHFHGAAGTVTGSCYRIEHAGGTFLVDCGLFQGTKTLRELNYNPFPFKPREIDYVLLTHAHIDHAGLLPKLCKHGFRGTIHCTAPTRDLLSFMLPDSGHIQESDVERLNRRNQRRGRPTVAPIYTRADAVRCLEQTGTVELEDWFEPGPGVRARLWNAGHILGATSIEIEIADGGNDGPLRLLFSGDLGPQEKAFHPEPEGPTDLDYLVVESTYGNRDRDDADPAHRQSLLAREINDAMKAGGNLLVPVFAVERTQELLFDIGTLLRRKAIPSVPVFLDSPLAVRATEVFRQHAGDLEDVGQHGTPFGHPNFTFVTEAEDSMALDRVTSGAIILSASGMCDAGRIRYHLKNNLWRSNASVLFVGYQAPGTLGQVILSGAKSVRIHGEEVAVNARIRRLDCYSAHADRTELVEWVRERLPVHHGIFLTHGEPEAMAELREHLIAIGCEVDGLFLPRIDEDFDLLAEGRPSPVLERPRVAAEEVTARDWHNDYAAFILALSETLQRLPDNEKRRQLLLEMRALIADLGTDRGPSDRS